jgi:hypothetical protein
MIYHFDVDLAIEYSIEEAVILNHLSYWIFINKANERNFRDGSYWTFNTLEAFEKIFPFWDYKKIGRILQKLENRKVILSGNYNKIKFDRTKWYTIIAPSILQKMESDFSKFGNRMSKNEKAIPVNNTYSKPTNQPL